MQEWSGTSPVLRTYAQQEQNSTTPESGATPDNSVEDDLVLSALADSYETAPITEPSGYTQVLASPGPVFHYGSSFVMMGAVAWKAAAGGEAALWLERTLDGRYHLCHMDGSEAVSGADHVAELMIDWLLEATK